VADPSRVSIAALQGIAPYPGGGDAVTPFLNNAVTVPVMAPIATNFAFTLGFKPEAF
jgi:hypothetical protein